MKQSGENVTMPTNDGEKEAEAEDESFKGDLDDLIPRAASSATLAGPKPLTKPKPVKPAVAKPDNDGKKGLA
jgi:hypothetical protein